MPPKLLVGVSAGGCLAMKYLGSQHARKTAPFWAAVSISNAYELVPLMRGLESRPCADALLVSALLGVLKNNMTSVSQRLFRAQDLMTCHSVADFEGRLMPPLYRDKFATLEDYYEANSCHGSLCDIQPGLPVLFMGALDDPLIPPHLHLHAVRYAASGRNPRAVSVLTERGGHLGWLSGWAGRRWDMQLAFQFLDHHLGYKICEACVRNGGAERDSSRPDLGLREDSIGMWAHF
jgi:predicted alpha/beta-fold hydrolase